MAPTRPRYALIGHPVGHSRSPSIHCAFAAQTGEKLDYDLLDVTPAGLADAVDAFLDGGGRGLNFTVPHKQAAVALVERLSERARLAGAVNTLVLTDAGRLGENTDGAGLVRDLDRNHGYRLAGRRILLLGAGGAARGALGPLLETGPARLHIANRTAEGAIALAAAFRRLGPVSGSGLDALAGQAFDLIVNATSAGLTGPLPELPGGLIGADGFCYDMLYAAEPTPFAVWAQAAGAGRIALGWGMLVEQAAEAHYLWRGRRPDTRPVIAALMRGELV